jgi:hypothetical protein
MFIAVTIYIENRMRNVFFVGLFFALSFFTACTKTKINIVAIENSPISTLSNLNGIKQWHGQYSYEKYDSSHTHITWATFDTSLSFALTVLNDSTILYNIFNGVDTVRYVRTNEFAKTIFYIGFKFQGDIDIFYYYSTNKIEFKMEGINDSGRMMELNLETP